MVVLVHKKYYNHINFHGVVNHSLHFVDPATGVHTHTVESYWNRVKTKLKGCDGDQLPSYLGELFMRRERYNIREDR